MEFNLNDCLSTIIKVWSESQQLQPKAFLPQMQAWNHAHTHEHAKSFVVDSQYKPPKQFDMSAYHVHCLEVQTYQRTYSMYHNFYC